MVPVVGLGTGRCGTRSLTKFLEGNGIPARHEHHKLRFDPVFETTRRTNIAINELKDYADIGFYWLNYVPIALKWFPETKFICLERKKEEVIESFARQNRYGLNPIVVFLQLCRRSNHEVFYYRETVSDDELEKMDPQTREFVRHMWDTPMMKYPDMENRFPDYEIYKPRKFLDKYWDEYHKQAVEWEKVYPDNFLRIEMHHALNTQGGNKRILRHIGVTPNTMAQ